MQPTISDGQIVLLNRWAYLFRQPRAGEVVVFKKSSRLFCKRVKSANQINNEYALEGDNPEDSLDSRKFGPVTLEQILGRAFLPAFRPTPNH